MASASTIAFGQVLRRRRRAAGLSQEALAERADVSRNFVSLLERGRHSPSLDMLVALAAVFACTPSTLVQEVQDALEERKR